MEQETIELDVGQEIEEKKPLTFMEEAKEQLRKVLEGSPEEGLISLRRGLYLDLIERGRWQKYAGYTAKDSPYPMPKLGCVIAHAFGHNEEESVGDSSGFDMGMIRQFEVNKFISAWDSGRLSKDDTIAIVESVMKHRGIEIF